VEAESRARSTPWPSRAQPARRCGNCDQDQAGARVDPRRPLPPCLRSEIELRTFVLGIRVKRIRFESEVPGRNGEQLRQTIRSPKEATPRSAASRRASLPPARAPSKAANRQATLSGIASASDKGDSRNGDGFPPTPELPCDGCAGFPRYDSRTVVARALRRALPRSRSGGGG
jgi:hypothetical protein